MKNNSANFVQSRRMDAIIRIKLSELDTGLVDRIKSLFQGKEDVELTITVDDKQNKYYEVLNRSKKDLEEGRNLTTFTIEELETYSDSKKA
jgi:hypothetical protein